MVLDMFSKIQLCLIINVSDQVVLERCGTEVELTDQQILAIQPEKFYFPLYPLIGIGLETFTVSDRWRKQVLFSNSMSEDLAQPFSVYCKIISESPYFQNYFGQPVMEI